MKRNIIIAALLVFTTLNIQAQIKELPEGFTAVNQCDATVVKSQDRTGTCWSFSTTSFLESEIIKKHGKHIDISEIFTVRNIYMEKAQKYIRYHGLANFSQGSLAHDVFMSYKKYGMMPESAYSGKNGAKRHDHTEMEKELKAYLDSVIKVGRIDPHWKEAFVVILDKHLGPVKPVFEYEGKTYNARSFADEVIDLNMEDYIGFTSFTHDEYYDDMVVEVPDNFSDGEYYNLPLDEMMQVIDDAIGKGYTIEWDGDVSEIGFARKKGFAVFTNDTAAIGKLPKLPEEMKASAELRQALFDSYETTDDHLMHITGIAKSKDGRKFYVVKNSWGSKAGVEGYTLMSEAYMKMKTISVYVNQAAVDQSLLDKLED